MRYRFLPFVLSIVLLLAGCSTGTSATKAPATDKLSSPPTVTNADGVTLSIGMSRAECGEFLGYPLENGWGSTNREKSIMVISLDDAVAAIYLGEDWTLSNGVGLHMPIDEVRELLGEEDLTLPEESEFQEKLVQYLIYKYDDGSTLQLQFPKIDNEFFEVDTVNSIVVSGPQYDPVEDTALILGVVTDNIADVGDAMVETFTELQTVFAFTHTGEGEIKVYFVGDDGSETEIFSGEGDCAGEGNLPSDIIEAGMRSLRIEAEGEWGIVVKVPIPSGSGWVTNADGVTFRVGMSRTECEELLGYQIENGWQITNHEMGVGVLSLDDIIVEITCREEWMLPSGVKTHMPIDEVRKRLGEEDSVWPEDAEFRANVMQHLVYQYEDGGALRLQFFKMDTGAYEVDTVSTIVISGPGFDPVDNNLTLGVVREYISGEGNATSESILAAAPMIFDIAHKGDGAIKVYSINDDGVETEIFSGEGDCRGEGKPPLDVMGAMEMLTLRVEAGGEWRVVVKLPNLPDEISGDD